MECCFHLIKVYYASDNKSVSDSLTSEKHGHILLLAIFTNVHLNLQHVYALQQLENHLKEGACALDVGSGSGYLTAAMAYMVIGSNLCLNRFNFSFALTVVFSSFFLFTYYIVYLIELCLALGWGNRKSLRH